MINDAIIILDDLHEHLEKCHKACKCDRKHLSFPLARSRASSPGNEAMQRPSSVGSAPELGAAKDEERDTREETPLLSFQAQQLPLRARGVSDPRR